MQINIMNLPNRFGTSQGIDMHVQNSSMFGSAHADLTDKNNKDIFGPQCKVTISHEGRKRSEQMEASKPKHFAAANTERLLLRQQRQDETNKKEQSSMLDEISGLMNEIESSYAAGEDKETIENRQEALNRLLDLKAKQEEENERRTKEAADSVAGAAKEQQEIDKKNADLYLMLKSLEKEDTEEDADTKHDAEKSDDSQNNSSDQLEESASMLGVSAARRELQATGMIDAMFDSGYGKLAKADALMHDAQTELNLAAVASEKENLNSEERNQLISEHMGRAYHMMQSNYGEMMDLRRKGHQEIQDAKDLALKHIAINPLDGVDEAKQTMMDSSAAAALHEVSQNTLDKASKELEQRVQEEIDKRNDAASDSDKDKQLEEMEEIREQRDEELEKEELEQKEIENLTNFMN